MNTKKSQCYCKQWKASETMLQHFAETGCEEAGHRLLQVAYISESEYYHIINEVKDKQRNKPVVKRNRTGFRGY